MGVLDVKPVVTGIALLVATLTLTSAWPRIVGSLNVCYGYLVHLRYLLQPKRREMERLYWYVKKNPHLRGQ